MFRIPLGVYRPQFGAMVLPPHAAALAAIEVTEPVAIRPLRPLIALCARPVHRLAMTAMLKSQRGPSDLSLLTRSQLRATRFCFRWFTPHWEQVGRSSTQEN